jgi:hypothetical protein
MELDENKEVCGTCLDWKGKREWVWGSKITRVSPSARGLCERLKKIKPPHGGCEYWEKWEGEENG